ncbi:MAG: hypothetical protein CMM02_08190 [Rhodopirellula sp.]|nr:hypothetical protein [Rhodopirellula sp.]
MWHTVLVDWGLISRTHIQKVQQAAVPSEPAAARANRTCHFSTELVTDFGVTAAYTILNFGDAPEQGEGLFEPDLLFRKKSSVDARKHEFFIYLEFKKKKGGDQKWETSIMSTRHGI